MRQLLLNRSDPTGLSALDNIVFAISDRKDEVIKEAKRLVAEENADRYPMWVKQLENYKFSPLFEYPVHLFQPNIEVLEVSDTEAYRYSVESVASVWEFFAITLDKLCLNTGLPDLFPPYLHHPFRKVNSCYLAS